MQLNDPSILTGSLFVSSMQGDVLANVTVRQLPVLGLQWRARGTST